MPDAPCGRSDCPIVDAHSIDRRSLRIVTSRAGTERYRVSRLEHGRQAFTPSGIGNGRFSPLGDLGHSYVAQQRSAALLESALHEAAGVNPRIYAAVLAGFGLYRLRFDTDVALVDLRDPALSALGIDRGGVTGADALHYPCTRLIAERLFGAKKSTGLVWTSRQGALHAARNPDGLASEVLRHDSLDVAVVYSAPDDVSPVSVVGEVVPLVDAGGRPTRFVSELANLLRIAIL